MLIQRKCIGTVACPAAVQGVHPKFMISWSRMLLHSNQEMCGPGEYVDDMPYTKRSFHAHARNDMVATFKGDWLAMFDTDHQFEPDILARMVRTMTERDIGVLCGLYVSNNPPYSPIVFGFNGKEHFIISHRLPRDDGKPNDPVLEVPAAGAGCLLVRRWVFERIWNEMRQPPFAPIPTAPDDTFLEEGCYSEDRSFFWRCNRLKIPVYLDWRIECHHLETRALSYDDFYRPLMAEENAKKPPTVTPVNTRPIESLLPPGTVDAESNGEAADCVAESQPVNSVP